MMTLKKNNCKKFSNFHWTKSIECYWKIYDLITLTWRKRQTKLSIIIPHHSIQTTLLIKTKWSDWHKNWLTFPLHFLMNTPTPFMFVAIRTELTLCKHLSWVQMEHLMDMEHTCLMSILMTIIQIIHQKSISQPRVMEKLDSIPTFMHVERFACHYLVPGEAVLLKIGMLKCQHYCKFFCQSKPLLWANKFTLTSQASKTSKEPKKEKRRIKHTQTLLGMAISSSQWLRTFETLRKDLKMSLEDISIWKRMKSWKSVESGKNMPKKDQQITLGSLMIITIHGPMSSKSQKLSTNKCLIKQSRNLKNNWTNFPHQRSLILWPQNKLKNKTRRNLSQTRWKNCRNRNYNKSMYLMINLWCPQSLNKLI